MEPTTCQEAEPFALQVRDNSMAPEFWAGCVIIIDPTGRATAGAFVLAEVDDQLVLRMLSGAADCWVLEPLNASFGSVPIPSLSGIKGVVVQRAGARRKQHKRYDLS